MRKMVFCLFIFSLLIAVVSAATAQAVHEVTVERSEQEERVFGEYLRYLMQQEGLNLTEAIKEIQSLQRGRESIIQSYIKTEGDLQNLEKSVFSTKQSELDYYEKLYPQEKLPKWEALSGDSLSDLPAPACEVTDAWRFAGLTALHADRSQTLKAGVPAADAYVEEKTFKKSLSNIDESYNQEIKPPRFRILRVKEYTDEEGEPALDITLKNSGAEGDVSVAIATKDGVLISQPFYRELRDFSGTKALSFQLMQQPEQIAIQLETDGGTIGIPVFLRKAKKKPVVINVTPFEAQCKIGESVEYHLTLEGDPDNPRRYNLIVKNLPAGINSEILQAETFYPLKSIKFSQAFKRHELILRLTLKTELDTKLIGKAIPFLVACLRAPHRQAMENGPWEQLTITPIGVGKIAIEAPFLKLKLRLAQTKTARIRVVNMGSWDIPKLEIWPDDTILGITASASPQFFALQKGEAKEVTLTVSATSSAKIGTHEITITAQAKGEQALSEKVALQVQVAEREGAFFLSSTSLLPGFFLIAILVAMGIALLINKKRLARNSEEFDEEVIEEEYV